MNVERENDMPGPDRIELRSPKVRHFLGEIPYALERWGIIAICTILIALILVIVCVEYPYGDGESILEHVCSKIFDGI